MFLQNRMIWTQNCEKKDRIVRLKAAIIFLIFLFHAEKSETIFYLKFIFFKKSHFEIISCNSEFVFGSFIIFSEKKNSIVR